MRNELITKINEIIDENTELKTRVEYLGGREKNRCEIVNEEIKGISELEKKVLEYGKEVLLDKVIINCNINVTKLENGNYQYTSFEEWSRESIYSYYLPDNFSKEEIINILNDELQEKYNKKKAEEIAEFEKSEVEKCKQN